MYLTFFGLTETPFSLTPDPRYIFRSESFARAWSRLTERLDRHGGLAVLLGGGGIGKTLFSISLQEKFTDLPAVVRIDPGLTAGELLASIHNALRVPRPLRDGDERGLLEDLIELIAVREEKGERTIIVIDEAHNLRPEMLRHLQAVLQVGRGRGKPPGLLLVGQPELQSLLEEAVRSGVLDRAAVRTELRPFTERETIDYINHRLGIAGAVEPIFTTAASVFVYRFSQGVPRLINSICSHALLAAQIRSEPMVTARIVRKVAGEVPPVYPKETAFQRFKGILVRKGLEMWSDGLYRIVSMVRARGSAMPLIAVPGFAPIPGASLNQPPIKRSDEGRGGPKIAPAIPDPAGDGRFPATSGESAATVAKPQSERPAAGAVNGVRRTAANDRPSLRNAGSSESFESGTVGSSLSEASAQAVERFLPPSRSIPGQAMEVENRRDGGPEAAADGATPAGKAAISAAVREPPRASSQRVPGQGRPYPADIPEGMVYIAEMRLESAYSQRTEIVGGFLLDRTPVTNEAYGRFIEATGYRAPEYWFKGRPPPSLREHPVVGISLQDAERYAQWCGKRLPTSAEWEAAARSPDNRRFPWGNDWEPARCNTAGHGPAQSTPVGAFPDGVSADGCLDLVGNVWEWTLAGDPAESQEVDYAWVFGGSFRHEGQAQDAIARTRVMRSHRFSYLGFRCAGNLP